MQQAYRILAAVCFLLSTFSTGTLYADLSNNKVIDHDMAQRIEELRKNGGYSSKDFNACQITWSVRKLENSDKFSQFNPYEITFQYENNNILSLVNSRDGEAGSIQDLGLNCLEFNNYVYLFFDTLNNETRMKFDLPDLSYVIYSSDKGKSWSDLTSLHPLSTKAKFILPRNKFKQYVKIFGNTKSHALSLFNLRDETTYLLDPELKTLKTLSVYNRLSNFDYPADFYWHNDILYLVRGSCEMLKGQLQCPSRTYMETSKDFGKNWEKKTLSFTNKSYFLTLNNTLYRFYSASCPTSWLGLISAINRSNKCGYIKAEKLEKNGKWEKPRIVIKTATEFLGAYKDEGPIIVWQDLRFQKSRPCGYIPLVGCIDSTPFQGPTVIYAGKLDITNWHVNESIISYKN